ncbi:MFS transporter [Yinghuangia sp. YIM S09857]|uniref:MFS transporter n=1 Tax=Yinghuangia sp. YIM S09857 TaxID=3436929 RepID=UPI003F52EBA6
MTTAALRAHPRSIRPAEAGGTRTSAAAEPRRIPALWLALLATPVAATANAPVLILPEIAGDLVTSTATATWLVTTFAWAMAVGTPLVAGLLRHRGATAALRIGTAFVVLGTVAVVLSPWLPLLLVGRAAQAFGGAALVTVAMNLAGDVRRMGVITAGFAMWGAVGPLAGSAVTSAVSWRAALVISVVGLLAVPAVAAHLRAQARHDMRASERPRTERTDAVQAFDTRGAVALVTLVTALVLLPHFTLPSLAVAAVAAVLLALHVRTRPLGFVPVALLRSPVFLSSAGLAGMLSTAYFALLFAVPRLMDDATTWGKGTIGVAQMAALLVGGAASWVLAAVSDRLGRGRVTVVLVALGVVGPVAATFAPWAPVLVVIPALAVLAASGGLSTLGVRASDAAPAPLRPAAIGLLNLAYQLGGAFGPAIALLAVS